MADDLEEAKALVLADATAEGRCSQCGRRSDSDEAKLFDSLRSDLAEARQERDDARRDLQAATDSNSLYEAEVASLKQQLAEVG